jgi:hypothetical protein
MHALASAIKIKLSNGKVNALPIVLKVLRWCSSPSIFESLLRAASINRYQPGGNNHDTSAVSTVSLAEVRSMVASPSGVNPKRLASSAISAFLL